MTAFDTMAGPQRGDEPTEPAAGWYGVYPALVSDIVDPDGQGRVKVALRWSPDPGAAGFEAWARLATLMAGPGRGTWIVPDVHDEVLVAFEAGNPRYPYVVGCLWNGSDPPPDSMDRAGENNRKRIRSRNGVQIVMDDSDGREQLTLETPGGNRVVLENGPAAITVTDGNRNTVKLDSAGVTVTTPKKATIQASTAEITASTLTVNAGTSTFNGVVTATAIRTNVIQSFVYVPGLGNIL
jgi:uncharacterized protein involved in type VI secretion and phage assembly